jgi:hypothetical protein
MRAFCLLPSERRGREIARVATPHRDSGVRPAVVVYGSITVVLASSTRSSYTRRAPVRAALAVAHGGRPAPPGSGAALPAAPPRRPRPLRPARASQARLTCQSPVRDILRAAGRGRRSIGERKRAERADGCGESADAGAAGARSHPDVGARCATAARRRDRLRWLASAAAIPPTAAALSCRHLRWFGHLRQPA